MSIRVKPSKAVHAAHGKVDSMRAGEKFDADHFNNTHTTGDTLHHADGPASQVPKDHPTSPAPEGYKWVRDKENWSLKKKTVVDHTKVAAVVIGAGAAALAAKTLVFNNALTCSLGLPGAKEGLMGSAQSVACMGGKITGCNCDGGGLQTLADPGDVRAAAEAAAARAKAATAAAKKAAADERAASLAALQDGVPESTTLSDFRDRHNLHLPSAQSLAGGVAPVLIPVAVVAAGLLGISFFLSTR